MSRVSTWTRIALLAAGVGAAGVFFWLLYPHSARRGDIATPSPPPRTPEPAESSVGQLLAAPAEYEGKVVRVRAALVPGRHGLELCEKDCSSSGWAKVWVKATPDLYDELGRAMEEAYGMKNASGALDLTAVGKFGRNYRSQGSDSLEDNAPYKFELMRIEKASRLYRARRFRLTTSRTRPASAWLLTAIVRCGG